MVSGSVGAVDVIQGVRLPWWVGLLAWIEAEGQQIYEQIAERSKSPEGTLGKLARACLRDGAPGNTETPAKRRRPTTPPSAPPRAPASTTSPHGPNPARRARGRPRLRLNWMHVDGRHDGDPAVLRRLWSCSSAHLHLVRPRLADPDARHRRGLKLVRPPLGRDRR